MTDKRPLLAKIHIAKKELALADEDYRAILMRLFGKDSAGELRYDQLNELVAHFKTLGWKPKIKKDKNHRPASSKPAVRKVYALWNLLYKAEKVEASKPDGFIANFTRRQGKEVATAEWCDNHQLYSIIEALKAWCLREGIEVEH